MILLQKGAKYKWNRNSLSSAITYTMNHSRFVGGDSLLIQESPKVDNLCSLDLGQDTEKLKSFGALMSELDAQTTFLGRN
ncbi:hypothetical protein DBZ36_09750 [Alginatibacterium sediminis]|uniref:Uncharacterized protein n=1 Tax=Alginatibacterium sediminis TaxID=2164068 RepID=A0A420ED93_9ALTE|nr:hypothetical protein DBZ36_09750 [Alginatibacterium sediminis]